MGTAANHKRDSNQKCVVDNGTAIGQPEMTYAHHGLAHSNPSFLSIDFDSDSEWTDIEITDRDLALVERLLIATARNDVALVAKIAAVLPNSNLSLDELSFRDTETDQVHSMLGLAKSLGADCVEAYLKGCGMTNDFVNEDGLYH